MIIRIFIWILIVITIVNTLLVSYLNFKEIRNDLVIEAKKKEYIFFYIYSILWLIIFSAIAFKYINHNTILNVIYIIVFSYCIFYIFKKNFLPSSSSNLKDINLQYVAGAFFVVLIRLDNLEFMQNLILKYDESTAIILLLLIMTSYIFIYLFCLCLEFIALLSSARKILEKHESNLKIDAEPIKMNTYYNFPRKKLFSIIKCFFTFIVFIIYFFAQLFLKSALKNLKNVFINFINICNKLIYDWKNIFRKVIYISVVLSVIFMCIFVINCNVFSENTKDTYVFLSTIIIIPLMLHFFNKKKN